MAHKKSSRINTKRPRFTGEISWRQNQSRTKSRHRPNYRPPRGSVILPGRNIGVGKDYTLFARKDGVVRFGSKRKISFNSDIMRKKNCQCGLKVTFKSKNLEKPGRRLWFFFSVS